MRGLNGGAVEATYALVIDAADGCLHRGGGVDRVQEIARGLGWREKDGLRNIYIWTGREV